jgi:hypothetical protein
MLSRIPAGEYECVRTYYHKGRHDTYEITGVPGRTRILFHKGNTMHDVNGCVLLGLEFGMLGRDMAVLHSGDAFEAFMEARRGILSFPLRIEDEE